MKKVKVTEPKESHAEWRFRTMLEGAINEKLCDVSLMENGSEMWLYFPAARDFSFSIVLRRDGSWELK